MCRLIKIDIKFIVVIIVSFISCLSINHNTLITYAESYLPRMPSFGLFCEKEDNILYGWEKLDFSDDELLSKGLGMVRSEYSVKVGDASEFYIPFLSTAFDVPVQAVTVNEDKKVIGEVWYGEPIDCFSNRDIEHGLQNCNAPVIGNEVMGTIYSVVPNNVSIEINLSFAVKRCFVYDVSNEWTGQNSNDGSCSWRINNAFYKSEYLYFIVGNKSEHTFASSCGFSERSASFKEFIDEAYEREKNYYYEFGNIDMGFLYSCVNSILKNNSCISYDSLFIDGLERKRLNMYKFNLFESATKISFFAQVNDLRNYLYDPALYEFERKNFGDHKIDYIITLNKNVPYIIDSNSVIEKDGDAFYTSCANDLSFSFCSAEKTTRKNFQNNGVSIKVITTVCIVVLSTLILVMTALCGVMVFYRR